MNTITVKQGLTFSIELRDDVGGGYKWNPIFNAEEFELTEDQSSPITAKIGSSRKRVFTFKGLRVGKYFIRFEYKRVWETVPIMIHENEIEVEA